MKKIIICLISLLMIITLTGCQKENSISTKALEEGKIALANKEYDKAQNLFKLVVDEDNSNEDGKEFYRLTTQYLTLLNYFENEDYDNADKSLNEIKLNSKISSIDTEVFKLQDQLNNIKNQNQTNSTEDIKVEKETKIQESQSNTIEYSTYTNGRYGFTIKYPTNLVPDPPPANGDGLVFKSNDSSVELTASGINNAILETVEECYNNALSHLNVTSSYKSLLDNSYAISWEENGAIYYRYTVVGEGSINSFIIHYPSTEQSTYGPVVDEIYNSFKTPGISTSH